MQTENENINRINKALDDLDVNRSQQLESLKQVKDVENDARKKEINRLSLKYGPDDPRIQTMRDQVDINKNLSGNLALEIERSNIAIPKFDKNTWMVHGRVLCEDMTGKEGLTVSFVDENGKWLRPLGYACTDAKGYFAITYDPAKDSKNEIPATLKMFLIVSDEKRNILFKDTEPLYVKIGRINYKDIQLSGKNIICTPPESDNLEISTLPKVSIKRKKRS
jgi:hypothetical protein